MYTSSCIKQLRVLLLHVDGPHIYQPHSPHPDPLKPSYTYMTYRLAEQVAGAISCIPETDLLKVPTLLIDMDSLIQSPTCYM